MEDILQLIKKIMKNKINQKIVNPPSFAGFS